MAFERTSFGTGSGADPAPTAGPAEHTSAGGVTPAMRLQILATEHWSLLASRSLAWNESFSRAGMFLSTLSGGIVALALVAQASAFGDGFTLMAAVAQVGRKVTITSGSSTTTQSASPPGET